MAEELLGAGDVARLLNVTTERVRQLGQTYADFPTPAAVVGGRKVWRRRTVEAWIKRHPVRPTGRPRKGTK